MCIQRSLNLNYSVRYYRYVQTPGKAGSHVPSHTLTPPHSRFNFVPVPFLCSIESLYLKLSKTFDGVFVFSDYPILIPGSQILYVSSNNVLILSYAVFTGFTRCILVLLKSGVYLLYVKSLFHLLVEIELHCLKC